MDSKVKPSTLEVSITYCGSERVSTCHNAYSSTEGYGFNSSRTRGLGFFSLSHARINLNLCIFSHYFVHAQYVNSGGIYFSICCLDPPEIITAPSAQQVVEGNGVILFCNATGNPQPNVTWMKLGNSSVLSTSETLNLTRLLRGDNGALYRCRVENDEGSAETTAMITVLCEYLNIMHAA